jgi:serine/threonine-protein kinase
VELSAGLIVANRFRLVRKLGEGGMGAVWFAQHVGLETPCAVKFIHADVAEAEGVRARFEREARIAAQLRSPHVVQVLDYGLSDGIPYLAMEYLDGEDLAHRLARQNQLSARETVAVVSQVARALTRAHAAGLVHRDLKPENVFIVRDDDAELVKVLDFGIAKTQTTQIDAKTRTGAILGTPHYMSPEQAQGVKTVDHRSDLWALGVITYRSIVGRLPFQSDALGDLLMRIIVHPLPVPSQVTSGLPSSFDAWWARAAARDPAQRFQSAKELAESLATALGLSASGIASGPLAMGATPVGMHAATPSGSQPGVVVQQALPGGSASLPTPNPLQHLQNEQGAWPPVGPSGPPPAVAITGVQAGAPPLAAGVVSPQTMSTASHTYGDVARGRAPRRKGTAVLVALLAVAMGVGIVFAVRKGIRRGGEATPIAAADAPPPSPSPVAATAAATAAPTTVPAPPHSATAPEPEPTTAPARPRPTPRPRPTAPPTPTRTGKVVLQPPN